MLTPLISENGNIINSPLFLNHMVIFIQIAKERITGILILNSCFKHNNNKESLQNLIIIGQSSSHAFGFSFAII